jgi:transposase
VLLRCLGDALVRNAIESLLIGWRTAGEQKRKLELQLMRLARRSDTCRRMATIPGIGAITALTFITTIDNPNRLSRSTNAGAFLGLAPRRYQSGEVDLIGCISKIW